jgi:hypothetical protein
MNQRTRLCRKGMNTGRSGKLAKNQRIPPRKMDNGIGGKDFHVPLAITPNPLGN